MGVSTNLTNKPINPRGNDQSPKGYNRAELYTGKALDFDGVNDQVEINPYVQSGDTMAICFYMKQDAINNSVRMVFESNNVGKLMLHTGGIGSGAMRFGINNLNFFDVQNAVPDTKMHFYSMVYDSTNTHAYLYRDGVLFADENIDLGSLTTTSSLFISGRNNGQYILDGQLSGFKIFNTALTAAQVSDLYNNPEKIVPTGVADTALKLWLPMMEGAGTTAYDGSGNGNHGTISGATYVNGVGSPVSQTAVIDWNKNVNLLYNSENFASSGWAKLNSLPSSEQTGVTAPDGNGSVTTRFTFSAVNHIIRQYTSSSDTIMSIGVWVYIEDKGTGGQELQIDWGDGTGEVFDVSGYDLNTWYLLEAENLTKGSFTFVDISANPSGTAPNGLQARFWGAHMNTGATLGPYVRTGATAQTSPVLLPQGLTTGRDITGVNLFENVRKQGALNLDGNSWAEVHDNASLDITDAITLEAWVYWDGLQLSKGILGRYVNPDYSFLLYANTATRVDAYFSQSNSVGYTSMATGWKHIVGTFDGTAQRLYVDGVQVSSKTYAHTMITGTTPIEIGRYGRNAALAYGNQIAQPRIYNRALTAEEVQRNYDAGKNIYK